MHEEIRRLMRAIPFVPFTLFMTDGRFFRIPTADHIFIYPSGLVVVEDDKRVVNLLPPSQIAGVESQSPAA